MDGSSPVAPATRSNHFRDAVREVEKVFVFVVLPEPGCQQPSSMDILDNATPFSWIPGHHDDVLETSISGIQSPARRFGTERRRTETGIFARVTGLNTKRYSKGYHIPTDNPGFRSFEISVPFVSFSGYVKMK